MIGRFLTVTALSASLAIYLALEYNFLVNTKASDSRYEQYITEWEQYIAYRDPDELAAWLEENPDSIHRKIAENALEDLRWFDTFAENSVQAYEDYLAEYPSGSRAKIAKRQRALLMEDLTEYNVYLALNPDDQQIKWRRDRLLMERAQKENTKYAFEKFIAENPDSGFVSQAKYYAENLF